MHAEKAKHRETDIHQARTRRPAEKAFLLLNPTFFSLVLRKMTSVSRMSPLDLLSLNLTNLDPLTENYDLGFYLNYLTRWPSLFSKVQDRDAGVVGYSMYSAFRILDGVRN